MAENIPELGECWLPLEAVLGGGGPGGLGPFLGPFGLPGGRVSVIDMRLAMGLCSGTADGVGGVSPIDTEGSVIVG